MFIHDQPIISAGEDHLGRTGFSQALGNSLLNWKERESLVIGLYGKWGSGKSSIINLAKEHIQRAHIGDKPTIIEFDPWMFSDAGNLTNKFFSEISKQLSGTNNVDDEKLAAKLEYYASVLDFLPEKKSIIDVSHQILLIFGLLGLSLPQITEFFGISNDALKYAPTVLGGLAILIEILRSLFSWRSALLKKRAAYKAKSALEIKEEIKELLAKRDKKLVVIIDDIDRLSPDEMHEMFRLVRANADFPNTIYLLAFDKNVVEKNLMVGRGDGDLEKNYLEKIVQVSFDVPHVMNQRIQDFLTQELYRLLSALPPAAEKLLGHDKSYLVNVYHSGFKDFFTNLREVKRYVSSLEFNLSQMHKEGVMEVNTVDFFATEAIRIFTPNLFHALKAEKELFTSTDDPERGSHGPARKEKLEAILKEYPLHVQKLIKRLFPQVEGALRQGYFSYSPRANAAWDAELSICSPVHFDAYFTLIAGGDETEISEYELQKILELHHDVSDFEGELRKYIKSGKIRKLFRRLEQAAQDAHKIPATSTKNIVHALFNISDDIPRGRDNMFDFGGDIELLRVIYRLFERESDKNKNFEILKEVIPLSKGISGPVQKTSLELSRKEKGAAEEDFSIPKDKVEELKKITLKVIEDNTELLLQQQDFLYVLYRWKEWTSENEKYKTYLAKTLSDDTSFLSFLVHFVAVDSRIGLTEYAETKIRRFNFQSLKNFIDPVEAKKKIEAIQALGITLSDVEQEAVNLFMAGFEKRDDKSD